MSVSDDTCPYCRDAGKSSRLVVVQSTWKSAIVLCSDPLCIYPLDRSLHSVQRDWSQLGRGKIDDKEILSKAVSDMKLDGEKAQVKESVQGDKEHSASESATEKDKENVPELEDSNSKDSTVAADDDELSDLLDYLANLPNNAFTSFSELPSSTVLEILHQQSEILKVVTLPVIVLPEDGALRMPNFMDQKDGLSSLECFQQTSHLGSSVDKLGPRRYPQWSDEKEDNLSWLTAGISLVVHCRLIRCVLKSSIQAAPRGLSDDVSSKDCISALCSVYETAMRKFLVGITLCNGDSGDAHGSQHSSGDSGSGYETSSGNSNVLSFGDSANGLRIPRPIHQRIISHLNSCRDLVRQKMITSKSLANHPADVLAFLLSSNDSLKELSTVSFKSVVDCAACQQRSVSFQAGRAVTLELPPQITNFAMVGPQCCASMSCGLCGVASQMAVIEWQTFSPLLFLHFPIGLPEGCSFEKFRLEVDALSVSKEQIAGLERYGVASRGKYELRVTAVVAVEYKSDAPQGVQYVTWVRRGADFWMACREAHGPGSYISEWDPLSAPRAAAVRRCDVRLLLFEAQPNPLNSMHRSASAGFLDLQRPQSVLHQRYLSIMRQRRKEFHAAASSSPSPSSVIPLGSAPLAKKNMIQRFLHSELEHKALLDASRTRFQPYSPEVKSPPSPSKSEPNSSADGAVKAEIRAASSQSRKSQPSLRSCSNEKRKSASSDLAARSDVSALSLWPPQKWCRLSEGRAAARVEPAANMAPASPSVKEIAASEAAPTVGATGSLLEGLSAKDSEAVT